MLWAFGLIIGRFLSLGHIRSQGQNAGLHPYLAHGKRKGDYDNENNNKNKILWEIKILVWILFFFWVLV
jgi:hypothetical protein